MAAAGRRRLVLGGGSGLLLALGAPHRVAANPLRRAMLAEGEAALARGDGTAAMEAFQRAAGMQHEPEAELGIVRAHMQSGQYRQALAFGAHVAGAHLDTPAAAALYAWLLRAGGQEAAGLRTLAAVRARMPLDPVALAVEQAFEAGRHRPLGVLLELPHRMAPAAVVAKDQPAPGGGCRVVASGVLVAGGRRALVPSRVLSAARPIVWVRNGLGQTSRADVDQVEPSRHGPGVTALSLHEPLAAPGLAVPTPREPFAGSPGYVVEYPEADDAEPAWPRLRQGFVGASLPGGEWRRLGIDVGPGPRGGPVLDASGRLVGMALEGEGGEAVWLAAARWPAWQADAAEPPNASTGPGPQAARAAPDEVYERALRLALQVIVAP